MIINTGLVLAVQAFATGIRACYRGKTPFCKNHFLNMLYTWLTPMQNSLLLFLLLSLMLYALSSSSSSMLCIHHAM